MTFVRLAHTYFAAFAFALAARPEVPLPPTSSGEPSPLVWDAWEKKADLPAMTNIAYFTFWVTNISSAEATILSTETSCDCAVVQADKIPPWRLAPGDSGPLKVRVNTRGKFGLVTKAITVHSSHGTQALTIRLKIPLMPAPSNVSVRKQDMMAAQADRQAVFRGNCATCHALPAAGKSGETLFAKVCGICHTAEHRGEMVPDLAALKHATDAEYWRTWITHGKAGSLMPAFAQSEGGILGTDQITSLIEFLAKKYPSRNAVAADPLSMPNHSPATNAYDASAPSLTPPTVKTPGARRPKE